MYPIMTMPNGTQAPTPQGQYPSQQSTAQTKPSYSQSASNATGPNNYRVGIDQNIKNDLNKSLNDKTTGYHTPPPPPGTNQQANLAAQYQAQLQQQYAYMIQQQQQQQQQQVQQRDQNSLKQQQLNKGTYSNWS
jgi:hypothetical protein